MGLKLSQGGDGELQDRDQRGSLAACCLQVSVGEAHRSKGGLKTGPWEDFANMNVTLKSLQVPAGKALSEYQLA